MSLHTSSFWASVFFLLGVMGASLFGEVYYFFIIAALVVFVAVLCFFLFEKRWFALLIIFALIGSGYYVWNDWRIPEFPLPFGQQITFTGMVERVSSTDSGQQVDIKPFNNLTKLLNGVRVYAPLYPELRYGDVLAVTGRLKPIPDDRKGYYAKEGVQALLSFPKRLEIIDRDQGSGIKAVLYSVRDYVRDSFEEVLPSESATLMTGLVIGKSSGFSKEFNEKLRLTGTTHLVALSGYNIAIIVKCLLAFFCLLCSRRYAVWLCIVGIAAFVVMTGAEASVVRAAIMAGILVFAERSERAYSVRNAIAITAVVMVLFNPHILVFDIGFQLSFAALLGIVYIKPVIDYWFRFDPQKPGLLEWRKNLSTTIAAQLAVLPILVANFGFIAPLSIVTNVLILAFTPITMILGVCLVFASLVSGSLALFVALPTQLLLGYELWVINFFSKINFGINIHTWSVFLSIIFYALLILIVLRYPLRKG